jgi:hypothetical protein
LVSLTNDLSTVYKNNIFCATRKLIFLAFFAMALQINVRFGHGVAVYLLGRGEALRDVNVLKVNVEKGAAGEAFKMTVERNIGVVSHLVVLDGYGGNKTSVRERLQGIIYCCFRERGDMLYDIGINHVCGRMNAVVRQIFVYLEAMVRRTYAVIKQ